MITFIIWCYCLSCLGFNIVFLWYDSEDGITVTDLFRIILLSLLPLINTFGIFWLLHRIGGFDKVLFTRGSK